MTSRLTRRITSTQPHLSTPIITLSPPHSDEWSTYIPIFPHPVQWHVTPPISLILAPWAPTAPRRIGAQILARNSPDCFSWGRRAARQSTSLML